MSVKTEAPARDRSPTTAPPSAHPADSSRILLTLLTLVRQADDPAADDASDPYHTLVRPAVLRSLLSAIHYRDQPTIYHARRVALTCVGIARELGWDEHELRIIEVAALLHDIGKIGVPDSVLHKPGALSPDEAEHVAQNHCVGLTILQACRVHPDVVTLIAQAGRAALTPDDAATAIGDRQQGARILSVADMYDSLVHDQSYRQHLSHSAAVTELLESDRQLDRNVIAALRRWLAGGGQSLLVDHRQAADSIRDSAPVDATTIGQASSLCHAFAYLYVLESLYDAYYITDADLKLVVCSTGLNHVLPTATFKPGEPWSRRLIGALDAVGRPLPDSAYPLHKVLETNYSHCSVLKLPGETGLRREIEFHALPLHDENGRLHGVAEIVRDLSHSKKNSVLYNELREAANQDPLTGAANRGQLETRLSELYAEYQQNRCDDPCSIIFLDIDHFKQVNDVHDHATGDEVLVGLVRLLYDELYSGETLGRYGGEEFLILCPGTPLEQAVQRADRVRRAIQNSRLITDRDIRVTASLGVAEICPDDTPDSVLQRADQALFDAKRGGRNRVCYRIVGDDATNEAETSAPVGELVHTAKFIACQTADILVAKLKGFVEDHRARLLDVQEKLIAMRVGEATIFGNWGSDSRRQPVEMIVVLGEPQVSNRSSVMRRIEIDVTVRPVGRAPDSQTFESRASRAVELLRSHLLAD
jgi:diguanylate cyclase (GGDEF)-like protein/putative nucleotidyltransferase with HDIG domain